MNVRGCTKYLMAKYRLNGIKLNCAVYFLWRYYNVKADFYFYKFGIRCPDVQELWRKYVTRAPRKFENQGFSEEELMTLDYIGEIVKEHSEFKLIDTINEEKSMIADNLKKYRNMSIEKASNTLEISEEDLLKFESGELVPNSEDLIKFANAYNVDCIKFLEDNKW